MSNAKSTKRKVIIIAVVVVAIVIGFMGVSYANINVSRQDALGIAIAHVGGGTAIAPELDWEVWRWAWYTEVWHDSLYMSYISMREQAI